MNYKNIKYEEKDNVAFVTVDRPEAMNALNGEVIDELYNAFSKINGSENIRVAIITGAGKSFIAGADIKELLEVKAVKGRDVAEKGQALMNLIENNSKPIIAAINGYALGGGNELAMACDIRIASEKARFGQPETGLGIIPGYGGTQRLPRIVGVSTAKKLIYTGAVIKASEAKEIGLVDEVTEADGLMARADELAQAIAKNAPVAVRMAKAAINRGIDVDIRTGCAYEAEASATCYASEDRIEGLSAFVEKRKADFKNR